ncbi:MAG: undecaprenyldiphospho-muramoylpentapeptide beta-N-acetylglucosaminyltransferase, partial [Desulfobacteraceae bacterium]
SSGFQRTFVKVEGLKGRGVLQGLAVMAMLPSALYQACGILRRFGADAVLGVGGYSAGPVCAAARLLGIPVVIHEQNSLPGLTNKWLCRVAERVLISFEESRSGFPAGKTVFTGNPVREEILEAAAEKNARGELAILVVGGSQGAAAVNTAVVESMEILAGEGRRFQVMHQTGESDYQRVAEAYRRIGLEARVFPFIEDMAQAYAFSDLVVSRAGAGTVAELAAVGKPSVLIPYPYSANDHQVKNARVLADAGGAEILLQADLTGGSLADTLRRLDEGRGRLADMGKMAGRMGRPEAADAIVDQLEAVIRAGNTRRGESP